MSSVKASGIFGLVFSGLLQVVGLACLVCVVWLFAYGTNTKKKRKNKNRKKGIRK
jgi:hypothetical protein